MEDAANNRKAARVPGRPFKPGQSGNPSGRPKKTKEQKDALQMIRDLAPDAANVLRGILYDENTKTTDKLKAIEIILDRTYGKACANDAADSILTMAREILGGIRSAVE